MSDYVKLRQLLEIDSPTGYTHNATAFLYEYFMEEWVPGIPGVYALRTKEWKYMMYPDIKSGKEPYETLQDMDELYNLSKDPHELKNLADNPEYRSQLNLMKVKLDGVLKNVDRQ